MSNKTLDIAINRQKQTLVVSLPDIALLLKQCNKSELETLLKDRCDASKHVDHADAKAAIAEVNASNQPSGFGGVLASR